MPGDKLTIPEFAAKVKEKYPEYKDVDDTILTRKILEKYPEYNDKVDTTGAPPKMQPSFAGAPEDYSTMLGQAPETLVGMAQKGVSKYDADQQTHALQDLRNKYQSGDISKEEYETQESQFISNQFTARNRQADIAKDLPNNPGLMRQVLNHSKSVNPHMAGDIEANAYLLNSKNRANPGNISDIMDNVNKIKSRELHYDLNNDQVEKPVGFWKAAYNALGQHHQDMEDFDFYNSATPEQATFKYLQDQMGKSPDIPVEKGDGAFGWSGEQVGNLIIPAAKGIVGGAVGSIAGPAGAAVGAAAMNAQEFGSRGWVNSFKQKFGEELSKGVPQDQAFISAQSHAAVDGLIDAAVGGAIGTVAPELDAEAAPLIKQMLGDKALTNMAGKLVTKLAEKSPSGFLNAGIAGAGEAAKNIHNDRPISEDVLSTAGQMLGLHYLIGSLIPGENKDIKPEVVEQIKNGLVGLEPEAVNMEIKKMVNTKVLTLEQANGVLKDLQDQRDLNYGVPDWVSQENKEKIAKLRAKRNELENQLDPEHRDYADPALHEDIKEQINGVKKETADGKTEGRDGINEQIRQLVKAPREPKVVPEDIFKPGTKEAPAEEGTLIHEIKPTDNAIQEPGAGGVLQHPQDGAGSEGSERSGVESGQQGEETTHKSASEEKIKSLEAERDKKISDLKNPKPLTEMPEEVSAEKIAKNPKRYELNDLHTKTRRMLEDVKKIADCLWK